jgi:hypothetical protein
LLFFDTWMAAVAIAKTRPERDLVGSDPLHTRLDGCVRQSILFRLRSEQAADKRRNRPATQRPAGSTGSLPELYISRIKGR